MIQAIKNLFRKAEPIQNTLPKDSRIRIVATSQNIPARLCEPTQQHDIGDYISITADSWLFYDGETKDNIFFRVSTNWNPRFNTREAPNGAVVYFSKDVFQRMKYLLYR